jgi:hypothetical protein
MAAAALWTAVCTLALIGGACRGPAGAPVGSAFRPAVRTAPPPPDVVNHTAADIARAGLVSDEEEMELALRRLDNIERVLDAADQAPTGLTPVALDLQNAMLDDRRSYRGASAELLDRKDLDPAMRKRLELFKDDAPLKLASDRIRDALVIEFARAFNAVAEPLGRSTKPYRSIHGRSSPSSVARRSHTGRSSSLEIPTQSRSRRSSRSCARPRRSGRSTDARGP